MTHSTKPINGTPAAPAAAPGEYEKESPLGGLPQSDPNAEHFSHPGIPDSLNTEPLKSEPGPGTNLENRNAEALRDLEALKSGPSPDTSVSPSIGDADSAID